MKYITYKNVANPHVAIHGASCLQIKKRGGKHKYKQGEYRYHNTYDEAYAYANSFKFPVISCSFCKPMGEAKLAILIPTDNCNKLEKLSEFLKTVEWTTWGIGKTYRMHPPLPPPYQIYFFHRRVVKYRAFCFKIVGAGEVPTENILPEFRENRFYKNELIITNIEKIKDTPLYNFKSFLDPQKPIDYNVRAFAYIANPLSYETNKSSASHSSCNFWVEQYWPLPTRDPSELYIWLNERKQHKNNDMKNGDRVLFYETAHRPLANYKGNKTIYATGTILDEIVQIPPEEQMRGGKRWLFKRLVRPDFVVSPKYGIPLKEVKKILGINSWPQAGFQIKNQQVFHQLEKELIKRQEICNQKEWSSENIKGTTFIAKTPKKFQSSGKDIDEASCLAAKEKSYNAHKELLNKLNNIIRWHNYKTSENQRIDLFATIESMHWIFEVKSTNDNSFLSQIRNGIAQLYEYRFRYYKQNKNVKLCLVVQTPPPKELVWTIEYLEILGIYLCWPIPGGFYSAYGAQLKFLQERRVGSALANDNI